jgi:hypothetical protein
LPNQTIIPKPGKLAGMIWIVKHFQTLLKSSLIAAIYNLWGIKKRHWCWSLSSTAAASSWLISPMKSLDRPRLIYICDETGPVKELSKAVI